MKKEIWMYYETDGDSGYYNIELFSTKKKAEEYKNLKDSAYAVIRKIILNSAMKY